MGALVFVHAIVTLQAESPLIIAAGGGVSGSDAVCVSDANGLPMIPGTSLAGVLRHALARVDVECEKMVFGYQDKEDGARSRLSVGHGRIHGANDTPVSGVPGAAADDAVLAVLRAGVVRDHVRINGSGVADGTGKFDETVVPKGARWTFELRLEAAAQDADGRGALAVLARVLEPLWADRTSLGGRTRRGFGRVSLVKARAHQRVFDLCNALHREEWRAWREKGTRNDTWTPLPCQDVTTPGWHASELLLEPEDFWMFGRGPVAVVKAKGRDRRITLTPVRDTCILWGASGAKVIGADADDGPSALAPASGVKGALRHRALFHAHRMGIRAGVSDAKSAATKAMDALFGCVPSGHSRRSSEGGVAGRVHISDGLVNGERQGDLDHVSIDRFTGGPVDGRLFAERPLFGGSIRVPLAVDLAPPVTNETGAADDGWSLRMALGLEALACALGDLGEGRLALGGGTGRGHGFMRTGKGDPNFAAVLREEAAKLRQGGAP